jgi:hypothetical protein
MKERESPWNVRFYCRGCEEDLTDVVMSDIIKEAEDAGCEDPLAVANNLYNVGAIFKRDGEKRDPNREEILYMAEVGIFLLACQGTSTPGSLCDKCATEHLRTARKRSFKVLSSKSVKP